MALTIGDNFSYQGAKPLDARLQYATIAEMASKADSTLYDGIIAYCKADKKNYQWKSTNPVDQTLGKWREFESGGASDLDDLGDVEITDVADGDVLKYNATEEKWVNGEDVGGAGRAKSSAIAPVFDATATYAAGDRVTYEDELYVFNTAHTGAWAAADADKSDVDSEIPDKLTSQQMQEIKDAFSGMNKGAPLRMMHYSTEEQVVGTWIDGKPLYQKSIEITQIPNKQLVTIDHNIANIDRITDIKGICFAKLSIDANYTSSSIPRIQDNATTANMSIDINRVVIFIKGRGDDFSGLYDKIIITIQYTKTTDTPQ